MAQPPKQLKLTKEQAIEQLWRKGELVWKCHPVQKEMHKLFYSSPENSTLVWLLSRQSGKSVLLCILAIEQCLKEPNSIVKLLTDTKVHVKTIFEPIFRERLEDCPDDLKPVFNKSEYAYYFPNGSVIQLAGSDSGHYERLRGQRSNLVLVDEAGFCSNLYDVVKSVLLPTLTHTGGKIVLASTPPQDPDHQFYSFIEEAEMNGFLTKKTIYQNPLLKQEQIDRIVKEMGGVQSPKFKREYLVETIREEENVIFPEFDDKLEKEIVREWVKPPFYNCYVGMDLGYKDLTAVLFVYYDFRNDKIIVEDEIVLPGKDIKLPDLAVDILKKEEILWTDPLTNETRKPAARVSDINYLVTQELTRITHGRLGFTIPNKDDNNAAINNLRVLLANKKIIIHPRCKNLIRHLKNCKWKDSSTKMTFARSPDNGHYDTIDALKYIIRSVGFNKNPYPKHYNLDMNNTFISNPAAFRNPTYNHTTNNSTTINIYKKIFGKR